MTSTINTTNTGPGTAPASADSAAAASAAAAPAAIVASAAAPAAIVATDLAYSYPPASGRRTTVPALEHVSLSVAPGEFVAVIGANGTGKSTLLRLLAGLLAPDHGRVEIGGEPVAGPDRRVGFVFQEPRLLPWRSTLDNVAFPLELAGWSRERRTARAREMLRLVGLPDVDEVRPHELSGGMRQRVGIARALALEPSILLLDEPFSALDALTRERFNVALQGIWQRTGTSIVLVTHAIGEAAFLADRVLVLTGRPGRIGAEVAVPLARPRGNAGNAAALSAAAGSIRSHLMADDSAVAGDMDQNP
jgi:ABC-type nitrate/sulfonate/bicarbonate transport system ATPase subunit